jgi:hypothetical protein
VEIYIAFFSGSLAVVLLAVVYLADRYEPEPIELIQNFFLTGLFFQIALIMAFTAIGGLDSWTGPWLLVTIAVAAMYLPFQLAKQCELDEVFDGVVYAVAFIGGAGCVIHIHRLPRMIAASPVGDAIEPGSVPDLRDLSILWASSEFAAELGRSLMLVLTAVLVGALLAALQLRGWPAWRTALACTASATGVIAVDLTTAGAWPIRVVLLALALAVAVAAKRRSAFKHRPEPSENDVLIMGLKTVLMVFGAALLTTALLQATSDRTEPPADPPHGAHASGPAP